MRLAPGVPEEALLGSHAHELADVVRMVGRGSAAPRVEAGVVDGVGADVLAIGRIVVGITGRSAIAVDTGEIGAVLGVGGFPDDHVQVPVAIDVGGIGEGGVHGGLDGGPVGEDAMGRRAV